MNKLQLSVTTNEDFFRYWVEFMYPIHKLSPANRNVLAAYLINLDEISKSILDKDLLNEVVNSKSFLKKVADNANISLHRVQVSMIEMTKHNVFDRILIEEKKRKYQYILKKLLIPTIENNTLLLQIKICQK